ncbi:MAG: biopolymer transport protein ExbD, partial [Myxococcota bacterium]
MRLAMIAAGLVLAMGCGRGVAAERTQIKLDGLFEAIAAKPAWLRGPAYAKTLSDAARRGTTNGAAYALCSESAWAPTVALLDREVAGEVGAFDAGVVASAKCDGVRRLAATFAVRSANDLRIQGHHEAAALRWKTACALGSEIACETPATESPAMLAWTQAPKPRPASVRPQVMVSLRAGGIVVDGRPLKREALTAEVSSLADAALALRPELETPVVLEADASVSMGVLSDAALALLSTGLSQVDVQVLAPDGT